MGALSSEANVSALLAQSGALDVLLQQNPPPTPRPAISAKTNMMGYSHKQASDKDMKRWASASWCILFAHALSVGGAGEPPAFLAAMTTIAIELAEEVLGSFARCCHFDMPEQDLPTVFKAIDAALWVVYYLVSRRRLWPRPSMKWMEILESALPAFSLIPTPHPHSIPLILPVSLLDGTVLDVEMAAPLYSGVCVLLSMLDGGGHDELRAMCMAGLKDDASIMLQVMLSAVLVFGHEGLAAPLVLPACCPIPLVVLPKVVTLITAALKSPAGRKRVTWPIVCELMQVMADVHTRSWLRPLHHFTTIPSVFLALVELLHQCVPTSMWEHMGMPLQEYLTGDQFAAQQDEAAACRFAAKFVAWMLWKRAPNVTVSEAAFLVHVLTAARMHVEVRSCFYRVYVAHQQDTVHTAAADVFQALVCLLHPNDDIPYTLYNHARCVPAGLFNTDNATAAVGATSDPLSLA